MSLDSPDKSPLFPRRRDHMVLAQAYTQYDLFTPLSAANNNTITCRPLNSKVLQIYSTYTQDN